MAPFGQILRERFEGWTGLSVVTTEMKQNLLETAEDYRVFREEASELAYHSMDYFSGKPHDLRPEARNRLAQRSRIALMVDPLAGAEGDLRSNFALGKGVPMPEAEEEEVQRVIEEAWTDPVNLRKLTSFEAQQHRSRELLAQANLFPTAFVRNGRVRVGFVDADAVTHVVCDEEDEELPLYYVARKRKASWDYAQDRHKMVDQMGEDGRPRVVYYRHWLNVELAEREGWLGEQKPPAGKLEEGVVEHVRINRIGRSQFGTPPFARTLRFFSAMNELTEAHVAMAQAKSTFIAKRVMKGSPRQIVDAASAVLMQTGELGAARFGESTWRHGEGQLPPPPGSFWVENQSDKLESLNLSSGSSEAMQTAQIVRAPIAAAGGFQQGYLGDAQNAGSLAAATALELPTLMNVQAWQEILEQMLRWFIDLVLQEAVRSGRLGDDVDKATVPKTLSELNLSEAADRADAERRTGKSLAYSLKMPYPGRRQLPDVVSVVTSTLGAIPGANRNKVLIGKMLTFLFTHGLQEEDPRGAVEEILDEQEAVWQEMDRKAQEEQRMRFSGGVRPGERPVKPTEERPERGERKTSGGGAMGEAVEQFVRDAEGVFELELEEPLAALTGAGRNGG